MIISPSSTKYSIRNLPNLNRYIVGVQLPFSFLISANGRGWYGFSFSSTSFDKNAFVTLSSSLSKAF